MQNKFIAVVDNKRNPDYEAFFQGKADRASTQTIEGRQVSNEEVEAEFSERRDAA